MASRTLTLTLVVALSVLFQLAVASSSSKVVCTTPEACCDVCGADSYRCARGPCSTNAITKGFFFISMPVHIASVWDIVFTAYGMVPSLVPVVLALDLLFVTRTWSRVIAFLLIPIIAAINQGVLVNAFGSCEECVRPCGTCLGSKGFPSGHSANSVGFFLWLALETFLGAGAKWPQRKQLRVTLVSFCIFAPVPYSRVYLGDHTPVQILVGGINGAVFAILYFLIMRSYFGRKLNAASRWLARLPVPIILANDFYTERSLDDDVELAALKQPQQRHPTYTSSSTH